MWIARAPDESFWDDDADVDAGWPDATVSADGAPAETTPVPPDIARPRPRPPLRVGSPRGHGWRSRLPDARRPAPRRNRRPGTGIGPRHDGVPVDAVGAARLSTVHGTTGGPAAAGVERRPAVDDTAGRSGQEGSDQEGPDQRRRTVGVAAGAVVTTLVAGVLAAGGMSASPPPDGSSGRSDQAGDTEMAGTACVEVPAPAADVDGDGCPEALAVQGHAVTAGDARWTLGEPGDLVAIGDWDCDGVASPALLRPATGDVFVFPAWAPEGRPETVPAVRTVAGAAAVRAEPADGCDRLVVDVAAGEPVVVDEART